MARVTTDSVPAALDAYIQGQLATGALTDGQRLPPERNLAEILGCTRHELRRQLGVLERQGCVTRTVGRGTYLSTRRQPNSPEAVPSSPSAILEARMAWEPRLMALVATRATAADFADFRRCLDAGGEAGDPDAYEHADLTFHRALALATHNDVVMCLHDLLEDSRRKLTWGRLRTEIYTAKNWASCQAEHASIVAALTDRNADLASSRMAAHLQSVRSQFLGDL
ncbi:FadR/GntR family transcriptional regulator [Streptomyces sp. SDT5-1]|uniref:FadR/GntR family transcriptional regulator n=1 Tax=Streptomyces sp. SDT5-1 TaxID=3406418 RepID=UPI003FD1F27F